MTPDLSKDKKRIETAISYYVRNKRPIPGDLLKQYSYIKNIEGGGSITADNG